MRSISPYFNALEAGCHLDSYQEVRPDRNQSRKQFVFNVLRLKKKSLKASRVDCDNSMKMIESGPGFLDGK